jgi:crotonobetainyl-CoA:carnitine CoA-transferase CaiB-like acyl-CoA transferase
MARVLDLTSAVGAYATRLLGELGHDVVRIETPDGDALRDLAPHLDTAPRTEASAFHQFLNAGKRSFAADLATEVGKRQLLALATKADAVVASLPLPVSDEDFLAANPNLVLVKLDDGPPELLAYARSGLMAITGDPGGAPLLMGGHIPWAAIGTFTAIAAVSALMAHDATGAGEVVDVSAVQCLSGLGEQVMIEYATTGEVMKRRGARGGITAVAGALPCADGHWMICVPPTDEGWHNFAEMVGDPVLLADSALEKEAARREKRDEILDRVEGWSARSNRDVLVTAAQERHVPASPVTTPLDLVNDPQLLVRGFLKRIDHPLFGRINMPTGAIAQMRGVVPDPAPTLGAHNAEILKEIEEGS